ncbi:MAG: LacI family DNA-binding transcriptional regulator [Bradyrhizobiaceae bacterium]|nr:LacI family DNA-binding transcriptional regulator [Bradyrhizobiaceae bacterium]
MITIKDIARELGLSISTVGRALTDHPRISRETKERVQEAAERLGYVANTAARVMRGGSSHLISLLVPDIRSEFYSMVAHILSTGFESEGYHLTLSITDDDPNREMQQMRELMSARVAGVVIVPSANPRRETAEMLSKIPHVQLLRRIASLGDWFGLDDEQAIVDAANHLIGLGHKKIAYIGDNTFPTGKARYKGFRRAMTEAGLKIDDSLVLLGPPELKFGTEAVHKLVQGRKPATAIITGAVLVTLGVAEQLSKLNVKVPNQISIVGFGDGPWQRWWGPGLTTLKLPIEEITTGCALWLLHRLKTSRQQGKDPHIAVSPTTLVIRNSTAAPKSTRVLR